MVVGWNSWRVGGAYQDRVVHCEGSSACCLTVHQHGLTVTDYHTTSEVGQPTQAASDVTDNNKQRQQKIITETQN